MENYFLYLFSSVRRVVVVDIFSELVVVYCEPQVKRVIEWDDANICHKQSSAEALCTANDFQHVEPMPLKLTCRQTSMVIYNLLNTKKSSMPFTRNLID